MSVIGNSKLVLEKKYKDTYSYFVKEYELYKNKNYDKLILLFDSLLEKNDTVCAHKLCGAGNGGFFLTFSEKGCLKLPYHCVKIDVESNGVYGRTV